jgi:predicted TIM-barrel fold metal-dependent hydrolase
MEYRCISADGHVDLNWLPYDLFVANASRAMKDRMPYVTESPKGPVWVTKAGVNFGLANGKGSAGATSSGRPYVPGTEYHVDRMASTGLYDDGAKGVCRPTTPGLRIGDQDRDGVQAEVLYGLLGVGHKMTDRDAAVELYRIYNDWLADFCRKDKGRLIGLASIPVHDIDVAIAEIKRVAKLGVAGIDVSSSYQMKPLWHPLWDPLWKVVNEVNLPLHFHTIGQPQDPAVTDDLPQAVKMSAFATKVAGGQLHMAGVLASVIHSGALERYPNIRIVFAESGIGWIPYVLDRMDYEYEDKFKGHIPLTMKPSDYWRRQCKATFQYDTIGVMLLDQLGVETLMWGSDYPHADTVFPDSQDYIEKQFGELAGATRHKLVCENVGRLYGLM